jgi:hypothetical protein
MIVNYTSSGINKLKASLNDNARVIIYNCHMFIVQAPDASSSWIQTLKCLKTINYVTQLFLGTAEICQLFIEQQTMSEYTAFNLILMRTPK